jgi:Tol biopolymer transport system component
VLHLVSGEVRQLTPTLFQPGRVSWSPDGRTIVDVASTAYEYVEPMPFRSLATRGDDCPVFSPDGRWLAFVVESLLYVVPVNRRGRFTGEPCAMTSEVTDSS